MDFTPYQRLNASFDLIFNGFGRFLISRSIFARGLGPTGPGGPTRAPNDLLFELLSLYRVMCLDVCVCVYPESRPAGAFWAKYFISCESKVACKFLEKKFQMALNHVLIG